MRRVLVDHARAHGAERRGGGWRRIPLDPDARAGSPESAGVDLVELDAALERLARIRPRCARVVELRFFLGFDMGTIARELGLAPRTLGDDWAFARTWLYHELRPADAVGSESAG